jgi:histidinol-phosphate phosphatase family protein
MTIPRIDSHWTLFLDRDGVVNQKIENGYVLNLTMLEILPDVPQALASLAELFGRISIVTNQRGIARGLMNAADLEAIHFFLLETIGKAGGRIDAIFVCPHDASERCCQRRFKFDPLFV